jgi:uncharacterized protein
MFGKKCAIIGVIHVSPLPGAAGYGGSVGAILQTALADALKYKQSGVDALIVENMHDVPYLKGYVEPETTAAMAVICQSVKAETGLPVGVQVLAAANLEALGVAVAADLDFLRVEGFVYAHVGDEGIHESCAPQLIRRRAVLQATKIQIFADIKKKHSAHAITGDVSLEETAQTAQFFRADGVIVTGFATGVAPDPKEVQAVRKSVTNEVLVGSGVTTDNISRFAEYADAVIVGTAAKVDGVWSNAVDPDRVKKLVAANSKI